ncbi:hypothetical protein BGZ65_010321 [Modicella reniformis]|uniref:ER-bound oxygenase mpaB/mpaB'/Rubber oxygenase catalytic domain-containing protein n=1 Tax=Modicella reniformis TaxID=1440133 RepID=A0A9P6MKG9_9FUNG|nr:hypothetical protein BGZ65_010321 [Modicella reniformis]
MDTLLNIFKTHSSLKYGVAVLVYMAIVRHLRFKRINALLKKYPDPTLPLRNLEIAREVNAVLDTLEFPYLIVVSLEFALFKTYAIPTISRILASTKQFTNQCLKRADDTTFILLEVSEFYARNVKRTMVEGKIDEQEMLNDARRHEIAVERLNFIHGHYNIKQEDYLYTLALFITEPTKFISNYEWRPLTELEQNAIMAVWIYNGKRMGIKNIPESKEELKTWADEYDRNYSKFAQSNVAIADSTVDLLLSKVPSFTHGFGRMAVSVLLTPQLREAFGMSTPPGFVVSLVNAALWTRGTFIKYFMLPRRLPLVRSASRANKEGNYVPTYHKYEPVYPDGYRVEDLGPEKFLGKCPVSFHPSGITPPASGVTPSASRIILSATETVKEL